MLGDEDDWREVGKALVARAEASGDPSGAATAAFELVRRLALVADPAVGTWANRAAALAAAADAPAFVAGCTVLQGVLRVQTGSIRAGLQRIDSALHAVEVPEIAAIGLMARVQALAALGESTEEALAALEALSDRADWMFGAAWALEQRGDDAWRAEDWEASAGWLERALRLFESHGMRRADQIRARLAVLDHHFQRTHRAAARFEQCLAALPGDQRPQWRAYVLEGRGDLRRDRGDLLGAAEDWTSAARWWDRHGDVRHARHCRDLALEARTVLPAMRRVRPVTRGGKSAVRTMLRWISRTILRRPTPAPPTLSPSLLAVVGASASERQAAHDRP